MWTGPKSSLVRIFERFRHFRNPLFLLIRNFARLCNPLQHHKSSQCLSKFRSKIFLQSWNSLWSLHNLFDTQFIPTENLQALCTCFECKNDCAGNNALVKETTQWLLPALNLGSLSIFCVVWKGTTEHWPKINRKRELEISVRQCTFSLLRSKILRRSHLCIPSVVNFRRYTSKHIFFSYNFDTAFSWVRMRCSLEWNIFGRDL